MTTIIRTKPARAKTECHACAFGITHRGITNPYARTPAPAACLAAHMPGQTARATSRGAPARPQAAGVTPRGPDRLPRGRPAVPPPARIPALGGAHQSCPIQTFSDRRPRATLDGVAGGGRCVEQNSGARRGVDRRVRPSSRIGATGAYARRRMEGADWRTPDARRWVRGAGWRAPDAQRLSGGGARMSAIDAGCVAGMHGAWRALQVASNAARAAVPRRARPSPTGCSDSSGSWPCGDPCSGGRCSPR